MRFPGGCTPVTLPLSWTTSEPQGSQWFTTFTLQNDDGTPMDITGKTFELVIRGDPKSLVSPIFAKIDSVAPNAQGFITVDVPGASLQAVLNSSTTAAMTSGYTYALALWMDPVLSDATALIVGQFYCQAVAAV